MADRGSSGSSPPSVVGVIFDISLASTGDKGLTDRPQFAVFVLVVLLLCVFAVANLRRDGTGRRFLAVRARSSATSGGGS